MSSNLLAIVANRTTSQDAPQSGIGIGGLVLIASKPPAVNADTHDHGALRPSTSDADRTHTPIASNASANGEPCGTSPKNEPSSARAQRRK
jgi:hypothetical protein